MKGELDSSRIGFIGCGAMARALAGGLVTTGVARDRIVAADPFPAAREAFAEAVGARVVEDNAEVVAAADVVVIAVKPGVVADVLSAWVDRYLPTQPLLAEEDGDGLPHGTVVVEELAQSLGLVNDWPRARPSIFNDNEEFALLTRQDELMLKMLYDARLRPGMSEAEARPIVEQIAAELMP